MIYKTISSKVIIAKVFRDLKVNDTGWTSDAVEWIAEALDFIGFHAGFEKRSKVLKVENFRAKFPCDMYTLRTVEYNGEPLPMGFDKTGHDPQRSTSMTPNHDAGGDYYLVNPNYINTSFEDGKVKIYYDAFPLDEDGFPMVPDNIYYKTALQWYIIKQLLMGGFTHPQFNYDYADLKWGHYCVAAQNDAAYPSIDKMESLKNMWVRLIPEINRHSDFFMGAHNQENLKR